ncbi:MAG: choice-of-anchor J domain-containing protein [Muribaculaceae bacterium]|nr:choice-of-anchor J domain-containing protein [Muribaculaceae bacterium]
MNRQRVILSCGGMLIAMAAMALPTMKPHIVSQAQTPAFGHTQSMQRVPSLAAAKDLPDNLKGYVPNAEITGVYRVPTDYDHEFELLYSDDDFNSDYSCVEADGVFYVTQVYGDPAEGGSVTITGLDSRTWEPVFSAKGDAGCCGIETAYDPVTGRVYGCFMSDDMTHTVFGYIDFNASASTVKRVKIADLEMVFYGVAVDAEGQVYGITSMGHLYSVNKETGELTYIGDTGLEDKYMTSATIDLKTGRMYYAVSDDGFGGLYEINLKNGSSKFIVQFFGDQEVIGMYVSGPDVEDLAPAAVEDLSFNFVEGALAGTCDFTVPALLYNGNPASGSVTYTVKSKLGKSAARTIATGTAECGERVSCPIALPEVAMYELQVYVANEAGIGTITKVERFVGHDRPVAPAVQAYYSAGDCSLSWTPVTEGVNGGYINIPAMTYTIVRDTDGKTVASGLTDTSYTDSFGVPDRLTRVGYTVVAYDGVNESEAAPSPVMVAGVARLPFAQKFDSADSFDFLTAVDANGDEKTWGWSDMYEGAAKLPYSARWASDDWLMLPAIDLEKGRSYLISFRPFCGDSEYGERYEVKYGKIASPEGMTEVIAEPTDIKTTKTNSEIVEYYLVPKESGRYHIGFHGISDKDCFNLYIDDLSISAGLTIGSPKSVSHFKVKPGRDGECAATLTFKAPEETMDGEPLGIVSMIEVLRDGEPVIVLHDVAPGEEVTVTDDKNLSTGTHEWMVVAYNGDEPSMAAVVSEYIGFDFARPVTNIIAVEGPADCRVTITWDPVTEDIRGNKFPEGAVTYTVYERHDFDTPLVEGTTETSFSCDLVLPDGVQQAFRQFMVVPVTEAGENYDGLMSQAIPVGKAFDCPYLESFPDGDANYPLGLMSENNEMMRWGVYDSGYFLNSNGEPIEVYDGDGGMAVFFGLDPGNYADMLTSKMRLPEKNPELSMYFYPMSEYDTDELHVLVSCDGVEKEAGYFVMCETGLKQHWNRATLNLEDYAGKVVALRFRGVARSHTRLFMDHVLVAQGADYDLCVTSIQAPATARPGRSLDVEIGIANYGAVTASDYCVDLFCNGVTVASVKGEPLAYGESTMVKVPVTFSSIDEKESMLYARVDMAGDENSENDLSEDITILLRNNPYPPVTALSGNAETDHVVLNWTEPDMNDLGYEEYTEDFETGEDWQFGFTDWLFIDRDGGVMGAFDMVQIPDMTPTDTETNFFVFNCAGSTFPETWDAHSGTKYIACIYNYDKPNDDWAISPRLYGEEQEITFYAKSYHYQYLEDIEVLYTTEDVDAANFDPSKFISLGVENQVGAVWKKYSFKLPAGARHFAIRCISDDAMMLMVDDVTYIPYAGSDALAQMGYNVYRDGVRLNDNFVEESTYTDPICDGYEHAYAVTAVYDLGESVPAEITVVTVGVDALRADGARVAVRDGSIVVTGAAGERVIVVDTAGKVLFNGIAADRTVIPAPQGICILTLGSDSYKVIVK